MSPIRDGATHLSDHPYPHSHRTFIPHLCGVLLPSQHCTQMCANARYQGNHRWPPILHLAVAPGVSMMRTDFFFNCTASSFTVAFTIECIMNLKNKKGIHRIFHDEKNVDYILNKLNECGIKIRQL